ncbi:hypothetical protein [Poseidonocella sp. HB161398]|uniref:hypothetical protein n=1 Tax=Poseidonocella sp. HB161398 TaxID=2320855 RepID=UPI001108B61F|nr:hypothetical protein [Poseidonocella sp. HB161398]
MQLVVHAGMHKTGSSSIQETFSKLSHPGISYAPFESSNHSGVFKFITYDFDDESDLRKIGNSSLTREKLDRLKLENTRIFRKFLENSEGTGIFSAESISNPGSERHIETFAKIIESHNVPTKVIIYVRAPRSHMESAFQQMVKEGRLGRLYPSRLWPKYRARIDALDAAFGRNNVTVRAFQPENFLDGNVVRDFADFVGCKIESADIVRTNESISAEALALTFLEQNAKPSDRSNSTQENAKFIDRISSIGNSRLRFSDSLMAPILEENSEDLTWIESRVGHRLQESEPKNPIEISSESDLIELGVAQFDRLRMNLIGQICGMTGEKKDMSLQLLNFLRKI